MTSDPDWSARHASTQHTIQFFQADHLPEGPLRDVCMVCAGHAHVMIEMIPDGPELSAGLRKLLEAKDCFVRAALVAVKSGAAPIDPS
jgi:hypothetical protein